LNAHLAWLQEFAPHLTAAWRQALQRKLMRWFVQHKRDLPWRATCDPYAIWISESMLQQTQVATVIDYFQRFMAKFPTVAALAAAPEQEVLAAWAGLGYYRRARQLHAAAKLVMEELGGTFPRTAEELRQLPGVGRYTAGAVASIAYDQAAPILEANTQRVFARLLKLDADLKTKAAENQLWAFAGWILPAEGEAGSGLLNQAAMELGALVCKPRQPDCTACPLRGSCPTYAAGLTDSIPRVAVKAASTPLHHATLLVEHQGRWLVRLNGTGQWWTGLWDFPRFDLTEHGWLDTIASQRSVSRSQRSVDAARKNVNPSQGSAAWEWSERHWARITASCQQQLGLAPGEFVHAYRHKHAVTRYRITLDCFHATLSGSRRSWPKAEPWQWHTLAELHGLPLTAPAKKILRQLDSQLRQRAGELA
jgi:A/G-specific adenine glycosylase